MRIEILLG